MKKTRIKNSGVGANCHSPKVRATVGAIHELPLHNEYAPAPDVPVGAVNEGPPAYNTGVVHNVLAGASSKSELPEGWHWKKLGDVLLGIIGGGTPSKANPEYWKGTIPWLTVKDMRTSRPQDSIDHISEDALKESATNLIPKDTVIIATRVGLGKVIRVPFDAAINQDLKALIPSPEVDKDYLEYWIMSMAGYLESIGSGTTVKGIRLETLREISFPVAPPHIQKQIVSEIEKQFSRLDEAVAGLKRAKANLKRYKAAVLKAAVEGKLTEQWRKQHPDVEPASQLLKRILAERRKKWEKENPGKKYKEPAAPDTSNLPELPEGWVWATVDQLGEVLLGKMLDKNKHRKGSQMPYLRNVNIRWDKVDTDDLLEMFYQDNELDRYGLRKGDLLVCEGGEPGRAAIWDGSIPHMKYQKALHRVRIANEFSPRLLLFLLEHLARSGSLEKRFTGSTIKHFTRESFIRLPIPLPSVMEQKIIIFEVDRLLSFVQKLVIRIETKIDHSEHLRQALLRQYFMQRSCISVYREASYV